MAVEIIRVFAFVDSMSDVTRIKNQIRSMTEDFECWICAELEDFAIQIAFWDSIFIDDILSIIRMNGGQTIQTFICVETEVRR